MQKRGWENYVAFIGLYKFNLISQSVCVSLIRTYFHKILTKVGKMGKWDSRLWPGLNIMQSRKFIKYVPVSWKKMWNQLMGPTATGVHIFLQDTGSLFKCFKEIYKNIINKNVYYIISLFYISTKRNVRDKLLLTQICDSIIGTTTILLYNLVRALLTLKKQ